ncbi:MAG: hypothetical protein V4735_09960 [Pseudomonadota bacterium]
MPPVVPLRKNAIRFDSIVVGNSIRFSAQCPLRPLAGAAANVIAVRHYRFGEDALKSYQLQIGTATHYFLTVAEDDQGNYLSISRALNEDEQDRWFGRDALGFFTEQSSAKSIRCKADLMIDGDWAAARYSKTVDWVEGSIAPAESLRLARSFHYNLLVNESGEKALEIEHDDVSGENRVFVTVYRPTEDVSSIEATSAKQEAPAPSVAEQPLFKEPAITTAQPKQRPDFRRLDEVGFPEIHIERTAPSLSERNEPPPNLPSFLLAREETHYLSLDEVIPPEPERIRVGLGAARTLIERAMNRNVRVRDVLRDMLGLQSALSEEVIFELPLSDEDYRMLAMRYKLRPDHRVEIRSRLEEELRTKLTGIAKA